MDWHFTANRPIWQQLTELLTLQILKGEYPPGSKLPPVRELANQAGVNPNTMQRAMAALEQNGLAVANRTAGRTVTEDAAVIDRAKAERARAAVAACLRTLEDLGYSGQEATAFVKEELHHE